MSGTAAQEERAKWRANERADGMAAVARIYRRRHDDECHCEGCWAYNAATDEVEPVYPESTAARFASQSAEAAAEIATWPKWMQRNLKPPTDETS